MRVDAEIIKARMDDLSFVVVDARTPMEGMHACKQGYQTLCCMNDWKAGVGTNGSLFASEEDLKKELESKDITPDKEIICHCHSGTRASNKYTCSSQKQDMKRCGYMTAR
jgi:thiosulfate/3-mercaptopyruvate sulfurtransferase